MKSKNCIWILIIVIIIAVVGIYYFAQKSMNVIPQTDYKNISYEIDGQQVILKDGKAEIQIDPSSASITIINYFGNQEVGDFNNDGENDVAFLITQNNGGSGTFYYVVAALKTANSYLGTNAIFIGDRITPQSTDFINGEIIVNYLDRKLDESMVAFPTVAISRYFTISNNKLVEVYK